MPFDNQAVMTDQEFMITCRAYFPDCRFDFQEMVTTSSGTDLRMPSMSLYSGRDKLLEFVNVGPWISMFNYSNPYNHTTELLRSAKQLSKYLKVVSRWSLIAQPEYRFYIRG